MVSNGRSIKNMITFSKWMQIFHNPCELITMLDLLKEGKDMVIGSRYIKGINVVNCP